MSFPSLLGVKCLGRRPTSSGHSQNRLRPGDEITLQSICRASSIVWPWPTVMAPQHLVLHGFVAGNVRQITDFGTHSNDQNAPTPVSPMITAYRHVYMCGDKTETVFVHDKQANWMDKRVRIDSLPFRQGSTWSDRSHIQSQLIIIHYRYLLFRVISRI